MRQDGAQKLKRLWIASWVSGAIGISAQRHVEAALKARSGLSILRVLMVVSLVQEAWRRPLRAIMIHVTSRNTLSIASSAIGQLG
jgi:hypothetical protein